MAIKRKAVSITFNDIVSPEINLNELNGYLELGWEIERCDNMRMSTPDSGYRKTLGVMVYILKKVEGSFKKTSPNSEQDWPSTPPTEADTVLKG